MKITNPAARNEVLFMLTLATVCAMLLMFTRVSLGSRAEVTHDSINAVLTLTGQPENSDMAAALAAFNRTFARRSSGRYQWWQSLLHPDLWACEASGAGMWAEIRLVFIYSQAQQRIVGMRVVEQNETAGLGDRIADEYFLEQFDDLEAAAGIAMASARSSSHEFDAVSGATITSRAVETIINRALNNWRHIVAATGAKGEPE